ncbi:hypothetical protein [Streptomyces sp. NPDC096033]|uniref:hypothetical protein n=1 Tax=Streptomyces sp. NPDC096033 TaxID=3366071 RepID=UPI0037F6E340
MVLLAGQSGPAPGPFLLLWGLGAIVMGGRLATRRGAAALRGLAVNGLERTPGQQAKARRVPEGFVRLVGGILAAGGLVAVPASLLMMTRG